MTGIEENTFNEFHKITLRLLKILAALSEEQINSSPNKGWSPGQLGEHLLKSYASVDTLNGKTKRTNRPMGQKLGPVKTLFLDISIKMDSPEAILPTQERIIKKDLIEALKDRVEQIKEVIKNKDLSLTCTDFSIPEYGEFTRYEWIWFNIYHTHRHILQLENMRVLGSNKDVESK
ncbi:MULTISPECIES: DinB family protein [Salegentibacter]|uniref:DinB family protein n=1 Tax=Salegentibacter TaxID=143222 RepID=UPI00187B8BA2|nr:MULTISPECIES: DinB family protein [Salegentibacter]MBE7641107.1 DinB family protein [Salegentibacter sp. BLCTC]MBI6116560.1 DinB family protein [Salegentibacter maritimus]